MSLQLSLSFPNPPPHPVASPNSFKRLTQKNARQVDFDPIAALEGGVVKIDLVFAPPPGCHWTEDAPSSWQVLPSGKSGGHSSLLYDQHLTISVGTCKENLSVGKPLK